MANERNEQVSRRGFDVFNSGDMSVVDEITADGAVNHDPATPEEAQGPEGFKEFVQMYRTAFPDLHITVDDQVSDGDKVCTRWTSEGTNDGELMGMPATGKHVKVSGLTIDKIEDGKVVESWNQWDNLGLMQQLGLAPEPAGTAAG